MLRYWNAHACHDRISVLMPPKGQGIIRMRTSDADLLFVPDATGPVADHWQLRWQQKLTTAQPVAPADCDRLTRAGWLTRLAQAVGEARRPVILVGHGLGVIAIAHVTPLLEHGRIRGAFLVAPRMTAAIRSLGDVDQKLAEIPMDPLPFPSMLVASRNDAFAPFADSEDLSYAWGAAFVDAGEAGHLDTLSGHGPWPEGLMRFASFLSKL